MSGEWRSKPLVELVDPARGISYGIVQPGHAITDGVPIIRVSDVRNGKIDTLSPIRVDPQIESGYRRTRLRGGELLITIVGTVGETAIVPAALTGWNVARAIAVLPVLPEIGAYWVKLALRSPEAQALVQSRLNTTVQATLNLGDLARLPILMPPPGERERIASILGALDDKIDLNRRMNETLEAMARAIFQDWFVTFGPTRAKQEGRPPYLAPDLWSLFPNRLDDDGKPEGWTRKVLGHAVDIARGLSYKGSGLTVIGEGLPMHNLNSVLEGGGYKFDGIKFYSGEFSAKHFVKSGDLIVANTEQGHERLLIGYAAIVPQKFGASGLFSQHLYRMRAGENSNLTPIFLYHLLNSRSIHDAVSGTANGSTVNMLPMDALNRIVFAYPPASIIEAFSELVDPMSCRGEANISENETLAATRDLLLPKLMSGELRVKDAERAVAEVA